MFSRLLVPVDMSSPEAGARSCPRAREIQEMFGAEVHLLSVLPGYTMPLVASYFPKDAVETMRINVLADLGKLADRYFDKTPKLSVRTGKRAQEILQVASEWRADLVIFACRPKDMVGGELMLGSVGTAIAERAGCSVLVAR